MDPAKVNVPDIFPDTPEVRSDICDYFFEIQRFDQQIGEMLELIEQAGQLDNTLVVITSDNGMPFPRAKANLYDLGTRMPLAIRWPKQVPGGRTVDDFVNLTDLAPTFLEAAGLTAAGGDDRTQSPESAEHPRSPESWNPTATPSTPDASGTPGAASTARAIPRG